MWVERLALAKTAAGLSFSDDIVKRMLTKRQVQAQLLGGNAERGEHVRVADGDGAFTRGEAGVRAQRLDLAEDVLRQRAIGLGFGEQRLDVARRRRSELAGLQVQSPEWQQQERVVARWPAGLLQARRRAVAVARRGAASFGASA